MRCDTHVALKVIDGTDFVKGKPFIRIPLEDEKHAEIYVLIGVSGTLFSSAARFFAVIATFTLDHMDFGAALFISVRTAHLMAVTSELYIKEVILNNEKWNLSIRKP